MRLDENDDGYSGGRALVITFGIMFILNAILGTISMIEILSWWKINFPLFVDFLIGTLLAPIIVPIAAIGHIIINILK